MAPSSNTSRGALLRSLGPGIIVASAAIGGSHLVSSTQAGALYGWSLAGFILLINLLKYPFFLAGVRYTMRSGKTLIDGYAQLGRPSIFLLWLLDIFNAVANVAACCVFAAAIVQMGFPLLGMTTATCLVMAVSLAVLLIGHYALLNTLSKALVVVLSVLTVTAVLMVISRTGLTAVPPAGTMTPELWSFASLGFIVMLMGWMPCPIDISVIQSVWVRRQCENPGTTPAGLLFDFHLGYIVTALLAVVFLALGALLMHAQGQMPSTSSTMFTSQLIDLYGQAIGAWSRPLIIVMAFACMWGTTLTVLDGYARVLAACQQRMWGSSDRRHRSAAQLWMIAVAVSSVLLALYFQSEMLLLLKFAMVAAFCTTPVFAWFNYRLVTGPFLAPQDRFSPALRCLSWIGLLFLLGFLALFVYWYFLYTP